MLHVFFYVYECVTVTAPPTGALDTQEPVHEGK